MGPAALEAELVPEQVGEVVDWNALNAWVEWEELRKVGQRGAGLKACERAGPVRMGAGLMEVQDAAEFLVRLVQRIEWEEEALEEVSATGTMAVLLPRPRLQCRSSPCPGDSFRMNRLWVVEVAEEVCPVVDRRKPMALWQVAEAV